MELPPRKYFHGQTSDGPVTIILPREFGAVGLTNVLRLIFYQKGARMKLVS